MSRVGKHPVIVPKDCSVSLNQGILSVKGKLGDLSLSVPQGVEVAINDNLITVKPSSASKQSRALWGTIRARIQGMVVGTTVGFTKTLELVGNGFKNSKVLSALASVNGQVDSFVPSILRTQV